MTTDGLLRELRQCLGAGAVLTEPDVVDGYRRDMMPLASAGWPLAVVKPSNVAEVQAVVRLCSDARVPIVPRGAGSGLSGAANAVDGCVVLLTTRLNNIVDIDAANRLAVVEPGVVNLDFRQAVEKYGLFYPPDPSSYDWCTIGGNLATNAGGLCCVKYGVTTDAVLGLEVVLADGSLLKTGRRTVKGVAGYDLSRLFIGSEGTLGVITQATVSLRPLPQPPITLVAGFSTTHTAGLAVSRIVQSGVSPSLMEIMDASSIAAAEKQLKTDLGVGGEERSLLFVQCDSGGELAQREVSTVEEICQNLSADLVYATDDLAEGVMLLQARRVVLTALEHEGIILTDDVCVPRTRIAELITGCQKIGEELGLRIAVFGHAGDGNMHPTIVYQPEQTSIAREAFDQILALGLSLDGTVTGEHGIGRIKQDWLEKEIGSVGLRIHRNIKSALDPNNIFNPGAMFSQTNPN